MENRNKRIGKMNRDTPEITNLFPGDRVEILDERWKGEVPLRIEQFFVRSLERRGVEDWVNKADVDLQWPEKGEKIVRRKKGVKKLILKKKRPRKRALPRTAKRR